MAQPQLKLDTSSLQAGLVLNGRDRQHPYQTTTPELHYTSLDGVHFTRGLYGKERMSATNTDLGDGWGHIMAISEMHFKKPYTAEELTPYIRSAWIKARFMAPWIAVRTSSQPNAPPNSYMFTYKRSSGPEEAEAWADETIVWRKETKTLNEWEVEMKERHWKPCAGRFGLEMHLAKGSMGSGHDWFLMFTCPHWTSDGRGLFPVAERMFRILYGEMDRTDTTSYASLRWGEEVNRLPPTTIRTIPDVGAETPKTPSLLSPRQFVRPSLKVRFFTGVEGLQETVSLSPTETKSLNLLCKRYHISMTSAINSVLLLAELETMLRSVSTLTPAQQQRVLKSFKDAQICNVTVNIADMRTSISPYFAKRLGDCGTGGLVNIGFPTKHDMNFIRQCLHIGNDGRVHKNLSPSSFWEGVASDTQAALKEGSRVKPHQYHLVSNTVEQMAPKVNGFVMSAPGIMSSSLGDVEKLGWFTKYSPLYADKYPDSEFTIRDLRFGMRTVNSAARVVHAWQYNGRLNVNIQGSRRWQTQESWNMFLELVRENFQDTVAFKSAL
ncbi:hypothetical protein D9758_008587 [Tetrapyrgos nigripes]|uniref:Uncharacterized protein n=1 Tax=Tetrapyrgos nigripes TaxID=182062 RepID=A0A8H5G5K1_9AGAR|nr:hypothetical protein D9758_008587 [Tetrapyrgos nigripes]